MNLKEKVKAGRSNAIKVQKMKRTADWEVELLDNLDYSRYLEGGPTKLTFRETETVEQYLARGGKILRVSPGDSGKS